MRTNIPLLRQPAHSSLCGEACLKMIYAHHGIEKSIYKIRDELQDIRKTFKNGSNFFEIGLHIVISGFDCTMKLWPSSNNTLACKKWHMPQKKLFEELRSFFKISKINRQLECRLLLKFIENGGKFIPEITSLNEIKRSTADGIIALLNYSYLNSEATPCFEPVGHFVVPLEINRKNVVINDPHYKNNLALSHKEFLFMFYTGDAAILFIKKRFAT